MAVEKMQGISRLEQFVEELSEEKRAKELKQEKKRQKRKNRRKNKCGFDISEQEEKAKENHLVEVCVGPEALLAHNCSSAAVHLFARVYLTLSHLVCCRVLLSLWKPLARSVVAPMRRRRKRPYVIRASLPLEAVPAAAQTTANRVFI